jgi:hypothetical protein
MWLLFIPILIMIVVALSVATLFAGLFWLVGTGWPLLLIGLGMWLLLRGEGRQHQPRRRGSGERMDKRGPTRAERHEARAAVTHAPRPLRAEPQVELPIDVQVKVEQIRRKVEVLLGYADRFPPFSQDLYLVRQTASDYLPRTINAYLALSRDAVDKPLSSDGRTPRQELKAQLDLLDAKLDEIAQDLQRQDADRLLANRRFLEARFGRRSEVEVA